VELIKVDSSMEVEEVCKLMKDKNILSVPVYDSVQRRFVGQIDILEIMRFTALEFFGDNIFKDDFFTNFQYKKGTAGLLCNVPRCKYITVLDGQDTLETAMKTLNQQKRSAMVLLKRENTSTYEYKLLSQMDIVRFLFKKIDKTGCNVTIQDLEIAGNSVVSISSKEQAVNGFQKMYKDQIGAVAIVDDRSGKLVANLSASDLRGISYQTIAGVKLPVLDFLEMMTGKKVSKPIFCMPNDLLLDVLSKIILHNIHRVWVTDTERKPIGVVTLTDIINAVLRL